MDITRTTTPNTGSPSYQLEGRTAKNLYKGPSGELADKIDKVYERKNRINKSFANPKEHIQRKYFDPTYSHLSWIMHTVAMKHLVLMGK